MESNSSSSAEILFITLSNIGDVVMSTPTLLALHNLYPDATIDIVSDRRSKILFTYCPFLGELLEKDKKSWLRGAPLLAAKLFKKKYQLAVDIRTDGMLYLVRAHKKLGKQNNYKNGLHSVEKHLSVLAPLSGNFNTGKCHVWTGPDDDNRAKLLLAENINKKILCIGAGANQARKIWHHQNYINLVNRIQGEFDHLVLLGNEKDISIADEIGRASNLQSTNLCGKTTLLQAAAVLGHASLFIGSDSGLGHLAAAKLVPTCTLFGPGQPEVYRPWGNDSVYLVGENQYINRIPVEGVIETLASSGQISRK